MGMSGVPRTSIGPRETMSRFPGEDALTPPSGPARSTHRSLAVK
jgi:hypothetical protein